MNSLTHDRNCAWCLEELGIVPLRGSHGVCERHMIIILLQLVERRQARARLAATPNSAVVEVARV